VGQRRAHGVAADVDHRHPVLVDQPSVVLDESVDVDFSVRRHAVPLASTPVVGRVLETLGTRAPRRPGAPTSCGHRRWSDDMWTTTPPGAADDRSI
jgi:hypothetical protein